MFFKITKNNDINTSWSFVAPEDHLPRGVFVMVEVSFREFKKNLNLETATLQQ